MSDFRPCVLIPTYDNPATIGSVVARMREHWPHVVVVDDGSGPDARAAIDTLVKGGLCALERRAQNGGKGAAVKTGLRAARRSATPTRYRSTPTASTTSTTSRASSTPRGRQPAQPGARPAGVRRDACRARACTAGASRSSGRPSRPSAATIGDPLCGFRVYPIDAALRAEARGDRMDFDPEIAVRMVWPGVPCERCRRACATSPRDEGGVSHFQRVRDNVRISAIHTRLVFDWRALVAALRLCRARRARARSASGAPKERSDERGAGGGRGWLEAREVGSVFGIRVLLALATAFGRLAGAAAAARDRALLHADARARAAASRDYLRRIGRACGFRAVYRHVLRFAQCAARSAVPRRGQARARSRSTPTATTT